MPDSIRIVASSGSSDALGPYFALEIGYLNQLVRAQPEVLRHIGLLWLDFIW